MTPLSCFYNSKAPLLCSSRCSGLFRLVSQERRNQWCGACFVHSPEMRWPKCMQGNPVFQQSQPASVPRSQGEAVLQEWTLISVQGRQQTPTTPTAPSPLQLSTRNQKLIPQHVLPTIKIFLHTKRKECVILCLTAPPGDSHHNNIYGVTAWGSVKKLVKAL